jgi:hypothetical protein
MRLALPGGPRAVGVTSAFGLMCGREVEDASDDGLEGRRASGDDAEVDLDKAPELDVVCAGDLLVGKLTRGKRRVRTRTGRDRHAWCSGRRS